MEYNKATLEEGMLYVDGKGYDFSSMHTVFAVYNKASETCRIEFEVSKGLTYYLGRKNLNWETITSNGHSRNDIEQLEADLNLHNINVVWLTPKQARKPAMTLTSWLKQVLTFSNN